MRLRFFFSMALALAGGALFSAEPAEAESACVRVKIGEDEHLECPRVWAPVYGTLRNCAPLTVDSRPMVRCPLRPRPWEKEPAVATACAQVKVGEETHLECSPFWVPIYFASLRTREEPPLRSFRIGVPTQGPGGVQDKARAAPIPALDMMGSASSLSRSLPRSLAPLHGSARDEDSAPSFEGLGPLYQAAKAGDAEAMFLLGEVNRIGLMGLTPDLQEAKRWYGQAAEAGHSEASARLQDILDEERRLAEEEARLLAEIRRPDDMTALGWRYERGLGVPQDYARAAKWYHQAADLGDTRAMLSLERFYREGLGVPRSEVWANEWRAEAAAAGDRRRSEVERLQTSPSSPFFNPVLQWAAQGDVAAMLQAAWLYERGIGVLQDHGRAAEWYRRGAESGDPLAMRSLAWLYRFGLGVPQDAALAEEWRRKAEEIENKTIP